LVPSAVAEPLLAGDDDLAIRLNRQTGDLIGIGGDGVLRALPVPLKPVSSVPLVLNWASAKSWRGG
jgi:hypothetical protein